MGVSARQETLSYGPIDRNFIYGLLFMLAAEAQKWGGAS